MVLAFMIFFFLVTAAKTSEVLTPHVHAVLLYLQ